MGDEQALPRGFRPPRVGPSAYNPANGDADVDGAAGAAPVKRWCDLRRLGPGLLGFWALYFGIVALSNLTDLLRGVHVLPASWGWISGNLAFMASATGKFGVPGWVNPFLLAGVVAWQGLAAVLFWRAARGATGLGPPFVVGLSLWAVFVLLDELLLIFETGAEATHLRLLIAQLVSLILLRSGSLGEGPTPPRG